MKFIYQQLFYKLIYILKLVELKIFKIYIGTNLANGFIWLFKSLIEASILYIQKLNDNFYLYIDY